MKRNWIRYGVTVITGLLLGVLVLNTANFFSDAPTMAADDLMKVLCNALFVPGILLFLFGCLAWIAYTGFFDGLAYGVSIAVHALLPFMARSKERPQNYYDYKMEKSEKRAKRPDFVLLIVGGAFMLVSMVFLVLYYIV